MPYVDSPINQDYTEKEGHDSEGNLNVSPESLATIARLTRKRGRFKIPDAFQELISRFHFFETPVEQDIIERVRNRYYERVEVTEDTIRNPYSRLNPPEKGKIVDDGGDFTHYTIEYTNIVAKPVHQVLPGEVGDLTVSGLIWLDPPVFDHLGISVRDAIEPPEEDLDLSDIGPRLWKAMSPTNPTVDLGVALAEIRDLPRLVKGRLDSLKNLVSTLENPKGLADWLLAIQFGWKPLLADIRGIIKAYHKIEARIDFLMRNGGQPLHRVIPLGDPKVETEVLLDETHQENPGWMIDQVPVGFDSDEMTDRFKIKLTLVTKTYESASGVFTYHLGDVPQTPAYLRAKLLGLIFDEGLIWDASPWTWLVDWFSNMGDVIDNVQANINDRVVSLYAYAQRRVVREYRFECSNGFYQLGATRTFDTKCRRKIDPFGLAAEVGLSDLQYAILIALGLTRA
ncbi:TPA_asm: maturation protein [ssRNA phage SRR6254353_2]|uniref:Maturation protein n=1 Tax=ssRNA phage SRR6254353_2 TaxID=2786494 RepID=A0A8S5L499_9VIRU|nr:maturation protein [ssRNA phage SRR6254353_2]DAD52542.1 TPA_asm: maturation protein [ssRNA phage SRR6254353_2]